MNLERDPPTVQVAIESRAKKKGGLRKSGIESSVYESLKVLDSCTGMYVVLCSVEFCVVLSV